MAISVYTGLMGSGKSYEVVSQVILLAVLAGRDVVTNVDGISEERIHDYLCQKYPASDRIKFGRIRHVTNEDVFKDDFLPYYDDMKGSHTDTMVQPGDLVCIDEAWRFWGTDCKLHKHHKSFFLEHRHFVNPTTAVACDLVLMIQDMGTLNRFVKPVVAFAFKTHKKVSLGLTNTYSVSMYEGAKMTKATQIGNWVRRYSPEVFPLYSSFKGGADGKSVNADKRQNILLNGWLWAKVGLALCVAIMGGRTAWKFFHPPTEAAVDSKASANSAKDKTSNGATATAPALSAGPELSSWRIAGRLIVNSESVVLLTDGAGRIRLESPSLFHHEGLLMVGELDGKLITTYSGEVAKTMPLKGQEK